MTSFLLVAAALTALSLLVLLWGRARAGATAVAGHPPPGLAAALAVMVLVIVAGGYAWVGSPSLLPVTPQAMAAGAPASEAAAAADAVAETLHRAADAHPQDALVQFNWARAELDRGHAQAAAEGYRRAIALRPRDADLLADGADVLAMASGGKLAGEPVQWADRALAIDPNHVKALAIQGAEALQRRDFATALTAWQHALKVAPPGDPIAAYIRRELNTMRKAAGLPDLEPTAPATPAAPAAPASRAG
jgi:cytochrome c-type biogenesis protein CcmH